MTPTDRSCQHHPLDVTLEAVALESLVSIKRAGADLILTYFAEDVAQEL